MRKRSGNVSFGSPAGRSQFSISRQVSPASLPLLSDPVKLIVKLLQQRPSLLTPSILPVWSTYSPNPATTAERRLLTRLPFLITLLGKAENLFPHQWALQYLLLCYLISLGRVAEGGWELSYSELNKEN